MPIPVGGYEAIAGQMLALYEEAELVMIRRVARRLARGVTAPGWTERKLAETDAVRRQLRKTMESVRDERSGLTPGALARAYEAGENWFFADAKEFALAVGTRELAPSSSRVALILSDLNQRLEVADRQILRRADDAYADVIGHCSALMATGAVNTREAVRRSLAEFADRGVASFVDRAGRSWQMGTYAEMAVLTATESAALAGYTETMRSHGYDLAIISAHSDACPICAAWQGVVVSVSGDDHRYLSLEDARAAGVFHPRCIHHISIYREGITHGEARRRPGKVREPELGYTARSRQRYCERMVRRYKRRQAAATSPLEERQAKAFVTKWQAEVRRTIEEAPVVLTRHYEREGGRVNLSEAAKKIRLNKTGEKSIIITDKQFGKKAGKHMIEWGLDPSDQKDRERFLKIIRDIVEHRDEVRRVPWKVNPQTKKRDVDVSAYIKGRDVVLLDDDGVFVTAMKDGIGNKRVQHGKKVE